MTKPTDIVPIEIDQPRAERFDGGFRSPQERVQIGQWYWVKDTVRYDGAWTDDEVDELTGVISTKKLKKGTEVKWLGCVMEIGSNFVELHSPHTRNGYSNTRVHFDDFEKTLTFEPDADRIIRDNIQRFQTKVAQLLGQVKEVTSRLGVVPTTQIEDRPHEGTSALAVLSEQVDTNAYKKALVTAKEKTLPELFEEVEKANNQLVKWMSAPSMPIKATIGPMKESIGQVEDRIYTIELYAGLTEEAVKVRDGDPAMSGEKLRVMQRRLYMDEECLANYVGGGIDIQSIDKFDEWISQPENRDRILPFPRTLVAFRVRRESKEREDGGNVWRMFVNIQLRNADKKTFLYVRNGEQVWRIDCDFEFDEMIIPSVQDFDPSQPMMVKMFGSRVDKMIPKSLYDVMVEEREQHRKWKQENPDKSSWDSPYRKHDFDYLDEYEPFDKSSVYYDEAVEKVQEEIKRYNRIAVIIQGLFDRSLVLHPHPPVRVWDAMGFEQAIELIYDSMTLTHGEKPDFEAYRATLNLAIDEDSIVTGQEDYWMRKEAEKENRRQENDWRNRERNRSNYTRYRPYGNPGPGLVSKMTDWKQRARKAVFRWTREGRWQGGGRPEVTCVIEVPSSELLNVSAYKPGDYKYFFSDPRTRAEYLQWAPLMLAAEDYHAGKVRLGRSSEGHSTWK